MKNKMSKYEDLNKKFKAPKDWVPIQQSFYGRFKRIPRKLKKKANRVKYDFLDLHQKLWYIQDQDYNRFLIKKLLEAYNEKV